MGNEVDIKIDKLKREHKLLAEIFRLKGRQDALISLLHEISIKQIDSRRKTIDIDTVTKILERSLNDNKKDVDDLMKRYKGLDKVIDIREVGKWTELK